MRLLHFLSSLSVKGNNRLYREVCCLLDAINDLIKLVKYMDEAVISSTHIAPSFVEYAVSNISLVKHIVITFQHPASKIQRLSPQYWKTRTKSMSISCMLKLRLETALLGVEHETVN